MDTRKNRERQMKIGEVYMMQFGGTASEQAGWRPGLIFQNNVGNAHSPNVIALPLTSSIKKTAQPTHVLVRAANSGLKLDSMVLCENPERMSKERIGAYITSLSPAYMQRVAEASLLASSAISYLNPEMLLAAWKKAVALNGGALCTTKS